MIAEYNRDRVSQERREKLYARVSAKRETMTDVYTNLLADTYTGCLVSSATNRWDKVCIARLYRSSQRASEIRSRVTESKLKELRNTKSIIEKSSLSTALTSF